MSWFSKALGNLGLDSVLGFAGGVLSSNSSNKANSAVNSQMIEWERERAKNAHQWEVEDLRKAGLNPILSAGGSGANTSGVSLIPAGQSPFSAGLNSALATRQAVKNIRGIEENNRKLGAEADIQEYIKQAYKDASNDDYGGYFDKEGNYIVKPTNYIAEKLRADAITSAKTALLVDKQIEALEADTSKKEAFAKMYDSELGEYIAMAETLIPLVGSALNPLALFGGSLVKKPAQISSKHFESGTIRNNYINN